MKLELQSLGLNSYESAAYVTLVREGISTALDITKKSTVPHGKIYPVLAVLEQKGFVKKFEGTPSRFMAVEPKIIIEDVFHRKELELKELKQRSEKLIAELQALNVKKPAEPLEKIKIITTITDLNKNNLVEWKKTGAEIREIPQLPGRFSIMDDTDVIIRISGEGKYLALWVQSPSLAKSSKKYFDFLWEQAKPL